MLAEFSGYLAVDEIYDGPFCILYAVDAKRGLRIGYRLLEKDPTEKDIVAFLQDVRAKLDRRGLAVAGVTTDGSRLYPKSVRKVFPEARHQVCVFHVLHEINKAVLTALMRVRRGLKADLGPRRRRGRPSTRERPEILRRKKIERQLDDLRRGRGLFIKKKLTPAQRRRLERMLHGHSELRAIRELVETVHNLFDRRCTTATARVKLERLREARLFERCPALEPIRQKLLQPNLERALESLDDTLLERTSNAVERSNRRHRKMQRTVYRVRSRGIVEGRIKLDMVRDIAIRNRTPAVASLHQARNEDRAAGVLEYNRWAEVARVARIRA